MASYELEQLYSSSKQHFVVWRSKTWTIWQSMQKTSLCPNFSMSQTESVLEKVQMITFSWIENEKHGKVERYNTVMIYNAYSLFMLTLEFQSYAEFIVQLEQGSLIQVDWNKKKFTIIWRNQQFPHWTLNKMADILHIFQSVWNAFSWMKRCVFWSKFLWILLLRIQMTISEHWFK